MFQPWYRAGLRFCCTRCGKCCTGAPGRVWVNDEEMAVIAEYQNEPLDQVVGLYTRVAERGRSLRENANGDCIFYDPEKGCTIYPVRPRQCQTWPFWESNVATPQDWQRTCDVCPGSGQGELISAEEISRRLKGFRV